MSQIEWITSFNEGLKKAEVDAKPLDIECQRN